MKWTSAYTTSRVSLPSDRYRYRHRSISNMTNRNSSSHFVSSSLHVCIRSFHSVGEKLVNFMVEPKKGTKWPKNLPKFKNRTEAIAVCKELCNYQYMHRSIKRGKGDLVVSKPSRAEPSRVPSNLSQFPMLQHQCQLVLICFSLPLFSIDIP